MENLFKLDGMEHTEDGWKVTPEVRAKFDAMSSGSGYFLERELQYISSKLLEQALPKLNAFQVLPVSSEIPHTQDVGVFQMEEYFGKAKPVGGDANDYPLVGATNKGIGYRMALYGAAHRITLKDQERARFLNKPLNASQAKAARRAILESLNNAAWNGDASRGIFGVMSHPYIPRVVMANPIDSTTTPDAIIAQINTLLNTPFKVTQQTGRPDVLLMGTDEFSHIKGTPRSTNSDTTILSFIEANQQVQVIPVQELNAAGPSGGPVMVAFRKDEEVIRFEVPMAFRQLEPFWEMAHGGPGWTFACEGYTAGVLSARPLEVVIGELP